MNFRDEERKFVAKYLKGTERIIMKDKKKKRVLYIVAGCMLLMILLAGGIYYTLTRYYFFNIHNLHAKKAMMEHLEYWYDQPFELLSTEYETVETKSDKLQGYVHIWTYTLADDKGEQFQAYVWLYSLVDKGAGDSHGPDYGSYISDTYVEDAKAGTASLAYEIDRDEEGYKVSVYDSQENLLYEDSYPGEPVVKRIGKDTLEIHEGAGNTGWSVFINGETGEASEPIVDVIACNEQIAVYPVFEDGNFKIIIRDIYNENAYEEITDDFPPVATGTGFIKEAKVLDRYTVYLDYYTGDSGNGDEWEEKKIVVLPKLEEHANSDMPEEKAETLDTSEDMQEEIPEDMQEDIPEDMLAYWLVLNSKKSFISANEGCQEFYWDEYFWCLYEPNPTVTISDFGIVDLDNDGSAEVVMTTGFPGATWVLDYQEGKVYSYQFVYRGMAGILTNGVYGSSSAADIGDWHRIAYFDKGTYEEETLAYMEHDYFEVEGKEVSSEEFFAYTEPFANGEQIEDMDYTEEMLDKTLLGDLGEEELSILKRVIPEEICDENNPYMANVPEAYEDVLNGDKEFICVTEEGQEFTIDGNCVRNSEGEEAGQVLYFSTVDMDGDGEAEIVLTSVGESLVDGKNLVLHGLEGTVYGYVFDFWGEMSEITKDGVFRIGKVSDLSGKIGCGKIVSFEKDGCITESVENYEYVDDNRIRYYFFSGKA